MFNVRPWKKKHAVLFIAFFILLWSLLGWAIWLFAEERARKSYSAKLRAENVRLAITLSNELNRIRVELPKLQDFSLIKKALLTREEDVLSELNDSLKVQSFAARADAIFVADLSGKVIASGMSSRPALNKSLSIDESIDSDDRYLMPLNMLGSDISHKPYFQQAALGQAAEYYDTDRLLTRKSYYFAFPVSFNGDILGVITLTFNLRDTYALLTETDSHNINFLVSLDGMIYASSDSALEYKTVTPFSTERKNMMFVSGRYGSADLSPVSNVSVSDFFSNQEVSLQLTAGKRAHLVERYPVQNSGWVLFSALDKKALYGSMISALIFYLTFSGLLFLLWLYLRKRSELQARLAEMNVELEHRVEGLTSGLKRSNADLKALVKHYQTAQESLEQTQYELLQTARLAALGELSATLNHELSQPALALRAYTENSIKLLARGEHAIVEQNFVEMRSICESMANIVSTIKTFARQSADEMRVASVGEIIRSALPIVNHLISKSGAKLTTPEKGANIRVRCIPEQIEQVVVNLISNATDAVYQKEHAEVVIHVNETEHMVTICVRNNHSNVTKKELKRLFDPYYTTKEDGLGIGLALCKRIIEAQDGKINARICRNGDIEFVVSLKKYTDK